jgi:NADH:ubiquinone oxidoreductase subunit K
MTVAKHLGSAAAATPAPRRVRQLVLVSISLALSVALIVVCSQSLSQKFSATVLALLLVSAATVAIHLLTGVQYLWGRLR